MAGVLNSFFNPLKLRETLNIGAYGIFKIQDPSQLRKTLQTARQRGGFQAARQFRVYKTLSGRAAKQLGFRGLGLAP